MYPKVQLWNGSAKDRGGGGVSRASVNRDDNKSDRGGWGGQWLL